jgi:hypothetical protein
LAVPDPKLRGVRGGVPKGKRPKGFAFTLWGTGPKATVLIGKKKTFLIKYPDGTGGIYQRVSKGRSFVSSVKTRKVRDASIDTLYRFTPMARIQSRLRFEVTVTGVIKARFQRTFKEALALAIANHAPRGNARRIAASDILGYDRARI